MKKFKIYCLQHPQTKEIRYIGVTSQKYLSTRLAQHYFNANRGDKTHLANWIRKNGKPVIELIEICSEKTWKKREKYWIKYYNNLTNHKEGGNGVYLNRSSESIRKSAKAHEKAVVQLDMEGNFIAQHSSIKKATKAIGAKSNSSICNVLKENYGAKTAFGYQWFYLDDYKLGNYTLRIPFKNQYAKL